MQLDVKRTTPVLGGNAPHHIHGYCSSSWPGVVRCIVNYNIIIIKYDILYDLWPNEFKI